MHIAQQAPGILVSDHRGNIFNINRLSYNLFFVIQYDLDTERQEKNKALCSQVHRQDFLNPFYRIGRTEEP